MRFKATIEYDGKNYSGWQIQDNAVTVQETLEKALSTLFESETKIVASGRTDTGVSARGQVVHFDSETTIPADKIPFALERYLPIDISMLDCEAISDDFHARYSAKSKTYSYSFYINKLNKPLYNRSYCYPYEIDIDLMRKCANQLVGEHNFAAFMATGSDIKTTVREIYSIDIEKNGELYLLNITGNGFLYNMVRIIVGTLLDIARGRLDKNTIINMLETGKRELGGHTAPAHGLCLEKVYY